MCGLAGYCTVTAAYFPTDEALLYNLHSALAHRGPEGHGVWISSCHKIALVHRRLRIIDLSDAACQPMYDEQENIIVSFNGEIYNYQLLRTELESLGYIFRSASDTEVIIYAYKAWGIEAIKRFDGMFAIALFDASANELYLIRDRLGIKPLYITLQAGMLSFASEIKALWQLPWVNKSVNVQALSHYMTFLATPAPMTLYEGIYKLPAGFYVRVDAVRKLSFCQWYNVLAVTTDFDAQTVHDERACVETIVKLLNASVKKKMRSDVPVGVFLSGGVDSSLNVALMAAHNPQLKTFNVAFEDDPAHEQQWARRVAKIFGTDHHELMLTESDAINFFDSMIYHQDEPLGDSVCIPLYYVAKQAKNAGVTVVQVGEGADELFGGYSSYASYLAWQGWWDVSQRLLPDPLKQGLSKVASSYSSLRRQDIWQSWAANRPLFSGSVRVFSQRCKQILLKQKPFDPTIEQVYPGSSLCAQQIYPGFPVGSDSYAITEYHRARILQEDPTADPLKVMIYLELTHRLPELLLMRVDKMAMATAIEARVPYLDHHLVEYALQIPMSLKYKNGQTKYILKKACEGILPPDIIYRKKVGFSTPASHWFRKGTYFKEQLLDRLHSKQHNWQSLINLTYVESLLRDHESYQGDYGAQLWAVNNVLAF
jgi:asparagine synthase (glutamine-hydrolysing)